ncbi:MAG: HAD family hydrolase [Deltaproteobacteria bacterium]|jgi:putative hydrolase of the HAD superfamily|nr:HAD family hydrolase [Deltaproteobacteria bacterium]
MPHIYDQDRFQTEPSAVLLDLDNTLYPFEPAHSAAESEVLAMAAQQMGLAVKHVRAAFSQARQDVKKRLGPVASSHNRLLYFSRGIESLGRKAQPLLALTLEQTYWNVFFQNIRLFDDVILFLTALKGSGIPICLVTDLTAEVQYRKILFLELENYFDYIVTSEDSGRDKPDPASFRLALELLQIPPERVWMIGDNPQTDIDGGRASGLTTLLKKNGPFMSASQAHLDFDRFADLHKFMRDRKWVLY